MEHVTVGTNKTGDHWHQRNGDYRRQRNRWPLASTDQVTIGTDGTGDHWHHWNSTGDHWHQRNGWPLASMEQVTTGVNAIDDNRHQQDGWALTSTEQVTIGINGTGTLASTDQGPLAPTEQVTIGIIGTGDHCHQRNGWPLASTEQVTIRINGTGDIGIDGTGDHWHQRKRVTLGINRTGDHWHQRNRWPLASTEHCHQRNGWPLTSTGKVTMASTHRHQRNKWTVASTERATIGISCCCGWNQCLTALWIKILLYMRTGAVKVNQSPGGELTRAQWHNILIDVHMYICLYIYIPFKIRIPKPRLDATCSQCYYSSIHTPTLLPLFLKSNAPKQTSDPKKHTLSLIPTPDIPKPPCPRTSTLSLSPQPQTPNNPTRPKKVSPSQTSSFIYTEFLGHPNERINAMTGLALWSILLQGNNAQTWLATGVNFYGTFSLLHVQILISFQAGTHSKLVIKCLPLMLMCVRH